MKKVVCFGLCFLIVLCSFAFCFASSDFSSPVLLPKGSVTDTSSPISLTFSNNITRYYSASSYPVYMIFYKAGTQYNVLYFTPNSGSFVYDIGSTVSARSLSNQYDGYYFTQNTVSPSADTQFMDFPSGTSVTDVIDYVSSHYFDVTFSLSYIVNGAVTWLSAVVNGVLQAPMLLFLILSSFVGIAVGLLFRFRRG